MFLRLVWGRQEEEGYPHDLRHHFCCSLLAQRNLIPPRSFNKEPTQWHLLLWNLRKCGISLTLNRFMTHTVTAFLGGAFLQTFPVTPTLHVTPWSHLRWGIPPPFPFPPLQRRSPPWALAVGRWSPTAQREADRHRDRDRDGREQERRGEEREGEEEERRDSPWPAEILRQSASHTLVLQDFAHHTKLKFIRNVCSSHRTLL